MKKFIWISLCLITLATSALAVDYGVGPSNESDTIYFNSSAKLEFLQGKTQYINGSFSFDPDNSSGAVAGILRVDLRTLKTGIEKRDEHMRDNHLHTDKYPYAYFELLSVKDMPSRLEFDSTYEVEAEGNFYIHGNYDEIESDLHIVRKKTPAGGETLNVTAEFEINLDEFNIPRPKALFLKLAETIEIEAVFTGSTESSFKPVELPDWPKLD